MLASQRVKLTVYKELGTWEIRKGGQDTKQPNPQKVQMTLPALLQLFRTHHSTAGIPGTNSVTWKKDIGTSPCQRDVRMDVWSSKHSDLHQKKALTDMNLSVHFLAPHTQQKGNMEGQHLNSELREFSSFCKSLGTWTEIMEEKKPKPTNQTKKPHNFFSST